MKRVHLIEFEDLEFFPKKVREGITDYLRFFISLFQLYSPAAGKIKYVLERTGETGIIDLCSGGGGSIMQVILELDKISKEKYNITLSDKFPNLDSKKYISKRTQNRINFIEKSIDAVHVPSEIKGLRTFFSSFHHFDENDAVRVLQNAVDNNMPIAIFEAAERKFLYIAGVILSTLTLPFLCTPFIKPFRWSKIFFTYIIPLIPLFALWDGIVSMLRIYNPEELINLTKQIEGVNYKWEAGLFKNKLGTRVTYLTGFPKPSLRI